jgi:hypothetical protein
VLSAHPPSMRILLVLFASHCPTDPIFASVRNDLAARGIHSETERRPCSRQAVVSFLSYCSVSIFTLRLSSAWSYAIAGGLGFTFPLKRFDFYSIANGSLHWLCDPRVTTPNFAGATTFWCTTSLPGSSMIPIRPQQCLDKIDNVHNMIGR